MKTKEEILKKLKKEFVDWRKEYMKQYLITGYETPGGDRPDNTYMLFDWFILKLQEAERETIEKIIDKISSMEKIGYKRHSVYIPSLELYFKSEMKENEKEPTA